MARVEMDIELARGEARYTPGEDIEGEVVVDVEQDVRCDGLTVELGWAARGRGSDAAGSEVSRQLFSGNWIGGESQRYAFSIPAPQGPLSYEGEHVDLVWELRAAARGVSGAEVTRDLTLARGEAGAGAYPHGPRFEQPSLVTSASDRGRKTTLFGIVAGAVVLLLIAVIALSLPPVVIGLVALLGAVGVGAVGWMTMRGVLAERALGDVDLHLPGLTLSAGDEVEVSVAFTPQEDLELRSAAVHLRATELVVHAEGSTQHNFVQVVREETRSLSSGQRCPAGEPVELTTTLTVPEDAPPSFALLHNELSWTVRVELDVAGKPTWERKQPVAVVP